MKKEYEEICSFMPENIRTVLLKVPCEIADETTEIRLRLSRPVVLTGAYGSFKPTLFGVNIRLDRAEFEKIICNITENSVYSFEDDINNGFITLSGGHRAGISGTAVMKSTEVASVRNISSVSIRVASRVTGAATEISKIITKTTGAVLIAGPPSSGKTTILRDLCERLGDRVAVIDERQEIAAARSGVPRLIDRGVDVLSGYSKSRGIEIAIRSFSPEFIICDEISPRETEEIRTALFCGVRVIASAHAFSLSDLKHRGLLSSGVFATAIVLEGGAEKGKIKEIISIGGEKSENAWDNIGINSDSFSGGIQASSTVGTA